MDDSESSGSSSTGSRAKDAKLRKLPYKVIPTKIQDVKDLTIGQLMLEKPSNLTDVPGKEDGCLYIIDANDDLSLNILQGVYHENILHLEAFISSSSSSIDLCVDKYTHSLEAEVESIAAKDGVNVPFLLQTVQDLLRQVINGVDELRVNGFYHGNLNLQSTLVAKDQNNGAVVVKLANFKKKDKDLLFSQFEDWNALGYMVIELSVILQKFHPDLDVSVMIDLGQFLQNLPANVLIHEVKTKALNHVYFWNKSRRKSFFVYDILEALDNENFIEELGSLDFIPEDWIHENHDGVISAMNSGRIIKYVGGRHEYIKFVSGAYTHEEELRSEDKIGLDIIVDNTISKKHPRLCLELVRILRDLGFDV